MDQPPLPESTLVAVRDGFRTALAPVSPALAEAGCRLLDRFSPPACAFEWGIAGWLGDAFGLPPEVVRRLVLCNLLGLAYVRLQDDLADGEVPPDGVLTAVCLATVLYEQALLGYFALFPSQSSGDASRSPFRSYLEQHLGDWTRATLSSHAPPQVRFADYGADDFRRLAQKGAPRKICTAAACLLAGRPELIDLLARCLDHLMAAAVLLDDVHDWESDWSAGRPNEFVAYAQAGHVQGGGGYQPLARGQAERLAVLKELYAGNQGRPYFAAIRRQLRLALDLAEVARVPGLRQYLTWFDEQARDFEEQLAAAARAGLRAATAAFFGPEDAQELKVEG